MLKIHKYANLFPMMSDEEYQSLKDDIAKNGLLEPIWTHKGEIIDGRNRARACEELGITPTYKELDGDDILSAVISLNVMRRSLNETQRAVIASRLETLQHGQRADLTRDADLHVLKRDDVSKILNVSPRIVATIKSIQRDAPEFIPFMESGEMTANEAMRKVNQKKEEVARGGITPEERYSNWIQQLGAEAWKDAILAAEKGTDEEKKMAVEFLTSGEGLEYYRGAGYLGDYQSVIDWVNGGCKSIGMLLIQTLCGSCEPIREYCPPSDEDEDDILYDLKHSR